MTKRIVGVITVLLSIVYPFVVYFYSAKHSGYLFIAAAVILLILRGAIGVALILGISALFMQKQASLLYPVIVSASMAVMFGYSLIRPPSLIEKFARITQPNLSAAGIVYTRKVTVLWLIFCCANALIALTTVIWGDLQLWTLYNGLISYLLMGLLFVGEYIYRKYSIKLTNNFTAIHQLLSTKHKEYWNQYDLKFLTYTKILIKQFITAAPDRVIIIHKDRSLFLAAFFAALHAQITIVLPNSSSPKLLAEIMGTNDLLCDELFFNNTLTDTAADIQLEFATINPELAEIIFYTSGSTGAPKAVSKKLAYLERELEYLHRMWGHTHNSNTFYSTVPHNHLYGLLFSLLWPVCSGNKIVRLTAEYWEQIFTNCTERDYIISSPAHLGRFPLLANTSHVKRCHQVFSSGSLLEYHAAQASAEILGTLPIEVFGSTETGGVAYRQQTVEQQRWQAFNVVTITQTTDGLLALRSPFIETANSPFVTADQIYMHTDNTYQYLGRADQIVKIEGKRVSIQALEQQLKQLAYIADCAVLQLPRTNRDLLGAVITLNDIGLAQLQQVGNLALIREIKTLMLDYFELVVLPRKWSIVQQLPTNSQGKRTYELLQNMGVEWN